jgi:hypothetical protein
VREPVGKLHRAVGEAERRAGDGCRETQSASGRLRRAERAARGAPTQVGVLALQVPGVLGPPQVAEAAPDSAKPAVQENEAVLPKLRGADTLE